MNGAALLTSYPQGVVDLGMDGTFGPIGMGPLARLGSRKQSEPAALSSPEAVAEQYGSVAESVVLEELEVGA